MATVLITGVTDGIGRALAQHDAAAVAQVVGLGDQPFAVVGRWLPPLGE